MPEALTWALPTVISLTKANAVAGLTLLWSYYDCRMHLSKNHYGNLKKQGLLLIGPGGYMNTSHTKRI